MVTSLDELTEKTVLENELVQLTVHRSTFGVSEWALKGAGGRVEKRFKLQEQMFSYDGSHTKSCMYIFKPLRQAIPALTSADFRKAVLVQGPLFSRLEMFFDGMKIKMRKSYTLPRNSSVPIIRAETQIKTAHYQELAIRFAVDGPETRGLLYTDSTMNLVKRPYIDAQTAGLRNLTRADKETIDGILGLNAYPSPEGFLWKQNGALIGVSNGHAMAAHQNDRRHVELIFARHLNHYNKDKGLWSSLRDHDTTPLEVRLIVETKGREAQFHERRRDVKESLNNGFIIIEESAIGTKRYDLSQRKQFSTPLAGAKQLELLKLGFYDSKDYRKGLKATIRNRGKQSVYISSVFAQKRDDSTATEN